VNGIRRLESKLLREAGRCIADYDLIGEGDRIMVGSSGGKDSYVLLDVLDRLRRRAPVRFELLPVHLDQGIPGHDAGPLEQWLAENGYDYRIIREDTFRIVAEKTPEGETRCALCSRLRRGILYNTARELECDKIALGHNLDDAIETLLLNLLFTGSMRSMPPRLVSDDGRNLVIRPLLYADEELIREYARAREFPVLSCSLYESGKHLKRARVKEWLTELESIAPGARQSILAAMKNVRGSHLLDRALWERLGLHGATKREGGAGEADGRDRKDPDS
jgi:tRNA 2-thiocytidine biosynthesis protein TtcA